MWRLQLRVIRLCVKLVELGDCWSLERTVTLAISEVIIVQVVELHYELLNCTVQRGTKDRSVCFGVVSFLNDEHPCKIHAECILLTSVVSVVHWKWAKYSSVNICQRSGFSRFATSFQLWSLHLVGDEHLPGMLPAYKQLCFRASSKLHLVLVLVDGTPIVMCCRLWSDCFPAKILEDIIFVWVARL